MLNQQIKQLVTDIWRERVLRARRMSIEQRLAAGGELFDSAVAMAEAGIRAQHPEYDVQSVRQEVRRRLLIQQKLESASYGEAKPQLGSGGEKS